MRGGINAKAIALQHLKTQIKFVESMGGVMVPRTGFEDWCVAAQQYLSFRILGVGSLRWFAKEILRAREHWKNQRKQDQLNIISEQLRLAEQRCLDRENKRKEKRLIKGVLATGNYPAGRPAAGEDRTQGPEPKADGRRKVIEPTPKAPEEIYDIWKKAVEEQETKV